MNISPKVLDMLNIGMPNDSGGTETEGTVMAKQNAILERISDIESSNTELKEIVVQSGSSVSSIFDKLLGNRRAALSVQGTDDKQIITKSIVLEKPAWLLNLQSSAAAGLTAKIACKINGQTFYSGSYYSNTQYIFRDIVGQWITTTNFNGIAERVMRNYPYLPTGTLIELSVVSDGTKTGDSNFVSGAMYVVEELPGLESVQSQLDYLEMMAE